MEVGWVGGCGVRVRRGCGRATGPRRERRRPEDVRSPGYGPGREQPSQYGRVRPSARRAPAGAVDRGRDNGSHASVPASDRPPRHRPAPPATAPRVVTALAAVAVAGSRRVWRGRAGRGRRVELPLGDHLGLVARHRPSRRERGGQRPSPARSPAPSRPRSPSKTAAPTPTGLVIDVTVQRRPDEPAGRGGRGRHRQADHPADRVRPRRRDARALQPRAVRRVRSGQHHRRDPFENPGAIDVEEHDTGALVLKLLVQ